MGLIDRLLSLFGGGSKSADEEPGAEPKAETEAKPEPEPEEEAEAEPEAKEEAAEEPEAEPEEEAEAEDDEEDEGMSTKSVAEMADPRRREDEANTVHNRAENPEDHATGVEEGEAEADEEADAEDDEDEGMSTKAVAEMADPRRREDEANTVHNRAENPEDQRAT